MMSAAPRLILRLTLDRVLAALLPLFLAGSALAAYNIAGIPIQWLAQAMLAAIGAVWLVLAGRIPVPRRAVVFALFLLWAFAINAANFSQFSGRMPSLSTLPYVAFVAVRYLTLLAFASAFFITLWLTNRGYAERLLTAVVWIGIATSLAALYIYVAQWANLPEPVRSRLGTGGGEQAITFSTPAGVLYRRALGTFREPAHLAEWLLLPLFASGGLGGRLGRIGLGLAAVVMLLTVSLTGILSAAGGVLGGIILLNPLRRRHLRLLAGLALLIALATLVFHRLPVATTGESLDLSAMIGQRLRTVFTGDIEASSRVIWLDLTSGGEIPVLGSGLGNANIAASERIGSDLPVAYVSLYVNIAYSTGVVGLILLLVFLAYPLVPPGRLRPGPGPALLMAYISYLVAFAGGSEELSVPFGIVAGLLEYYRRQEMPERHASVARVLSMNSAA